MRRQRVAWFASLALGVFSGALFAPACYSNDADDSPGDPPSDAGLSSDVPRALGGGDRIHELAAPGPDHPAPDASVYITGASFLLVDDYDETHNGKSLGSVYVQDVASNLPYSGLQLYKPTYSPASLLLAPGDVVDITGPYQDYAYDPGTSTGFAVYQTTPEANEPVVTFRFEYTVPAPTKINASDLANVTPQKSYELGGRWLSMLVEIDDVTITGSYVDSEGRQSLYFTSDTTESGPAITNQFYDLQATDYPGPVDGGVGTHLSKVIGVCTFFFNFQISPRSPADMVK